MTILTHVTKKVLAMDFFELCDHHYLHATGPDLIEGSASHPFAEYSVTPTEQILYDVASHMLSEMRKEYPNSILVCHL